MWVDNKGSAARGVHKHYRAIDRRGEVKWWVRTRRPRSDFDGAKMPFGDGD